MQLTKKYLETSQLYQTYQDEFLESQLNLLYGIYDNIDEIYKEETLKHIIEELSDEQWRYIYSNKPLRKQARWFFKSLKGAPFSKFMLNLWLLSRKIYRKLK